MNRLPHLVFVGDGELRQELEATAVASGAGKRIHFAGFVNQRELPRLYGAADVLVQASRETWGLTVNEAMACGTPAIVAAGTGCSKDLVHADQTGWVFPTGDLQALASRFEHASDPGRSTLAEKGSQTLTQVSRYSFRRTLESLQEITGWAGEESDVATSSLTSSDHA